MSARVDIRPRKRNSQRAAIARSFPPHLAWLRKRPCLIAGRAGHVCQGRMEAHHANEGEGGMGIKTFDYDAVPVCSAAHLEVHAGKRTFEAKYGLDLQASAAAYARLSPHRRLWETSNA